MFKKSKNNIIKDLILIFEKIVKYFMRKIDIRRLSMEAQQQLRYDVVKLRKEGITYKRISKILNVSFVSVWQWCKNYKLNY